MESGATLPHRQEAEKCSLTRMCPLTECALSLIILECVLSGAALPQLCLVKALAQYVTLRSCQVVVGAGGVRALGIVSPLRLPSRALSLPSLTTFLVPLSPPALRPSFSPQPRVWVTWVTRQGC